MDPRDPAGADELSAWQGRPARAGVAGSARHRPPGRAIGLLLTVLVAGWVIAAWQKQVRNAGPVRRRTTLRLRRRSG